MAHPLQHPRPEPAEFTPSWTFGDRLRKIRQDGFHYVVRQRDMAKLLEVSVPSYEAWETGRIKPARTVRQHVALKIKALTGIPTAWTLGEEPPVDEG